MYRFQDLYVTLPPKDGWLAQVDVDPASPMAIVVVQQGLRVPQPPSTPCCYTGASNPQLPIFGPPQDGVDPLWNYLTTGLAGAYFATDYFQEAGDLQSVAEAEGLESKLTAAITKVRDRKVQLQAREERMTL
jgi:hypothetical protein